MASKAIKIKGLWLEAVENKYIGAIIFNEGSKPEILSRIAQATAALSRLKIIWRDKNIPLASNNWDEREKISHLSIICQSCVAEFCSHYSLSVNFMLHDYRENLNLYDKIYAAINVFPQRGRGGITVVN